MHMWRPKTPLLASLALPVVVFLLLGRTPVVGAEGEADSSEKSAPRVSLVQIGANDLLADLEYILGLTNQKEQEQWSVIKDNIEIFLDGIDRTKPIRLDLIFGEQALRYVWYLPMKDFDAFRTKNLLTIGIKSRPIRGTKLRLFKLDKAFEGYLRHSFVNPVVAEKQTQNAPADSIQIVPVHAVVGKPREYALIAEKLADIPPNHPDPLLIVKQLVEKRYDLALDGENSAVSPADRDARRSLFQSTRNELVAAVRRRKDEDPSDFELRKSVFKYQLDELERIYVDGSRLTLGWVTDVDRKQGRLDLDLAAIPGTELEATIEMASRQPSYFANVPKSENPIFSGRLSHPLDELRKKNFQEFIAILRAQAKRNVNLTPGFSDEERIVRRQVADMVFDMLVEGTEAGIVDGVIEVHPNPSGKNTLVAGFKTVDGEKVVEILKLIPQTRAGQQSALDVDQQGPVRIHTVVLSPERHPNYKDFFGEETLYVGSCKEAVWCAAGENALAELKAAIQKTQEPNSGQADAPFLDLFVKLGPWVQLRENHSGAESGNLKLRKMALEAFLPGDDTLTVTLRRDDKRIVGNLLATQDILRWAGKIFADFSKENLQ